ncbi:MAG TPA: Rho termination factor N-terminal domain-containing protein, partial [Chitinophagaceae bacterium]|nr:Rho termination factor N-terminal domain-containing protein [Chitinophagaceae bacterium]
MYDILQLNEMLVPELVAVAEHLNIKNPKKLNKQDLIFQILDNQAITDAKKDTNVATNTNRKKLIKVSTSNGSEEAEIESTPKILKTKKTDMPAKKDDKEKEEKVPTKRTR